MKRIAIIFTLLAMLLAVMGLASCEKIPIALTRDDIQRNREPVKILQNFGLRINDATGEVTVFHNGRPVQPVRNGNNPSFQAIDELEVELLLPVDYTPLGCDDFANDGVENLRTIKLTFKNLVDGPEFGTLNYIVPTNITGSNLFGVSCAVETDVLDNENFQMVIQASLIDCASFSIFFDLDSEFTAN